jgi:hypothetical protein
MTETHDIPKELDPRTDRWWTACKLHAGVTAIHTAVGAILWTTVYGLGWSRETLAEWAAATVMGGFPTAVVAVGVAAVASLSLVGVPLAAYNHTEAVRERGYALPRSLSLLGVLGISLWPLNTALFAYLAWVDIGGRHE